MANNVNNNNKTSTQSINNAKQYTSGSLIYGAQHPPLKQQSSKHNKSDPNYVEFDNKTLDAWDIKLDDDLEEFKYQISAQASHEMAKKVIKNHQQKQQQQQQQQKAHQQSPKIVPGKALRQAIIAEPKLNESPRVNKMDQLLERRVSNENNLLEQNELKQEQEPITSLSIKQDKFQLLINTSNLQINLEELQKACWKGIPKKYRPQCWKLLSDYLPLNVELQLKTIEQKRQAYWDAVSEHYSKMYLEAHHDTLRQIMNDIPRMNPLMPIFQNKLIQDIFQRILYVWSVRHPASGYVQGINDLVTPFFAVFIQEYVDNGHGDFDLTDLVMLTREHQFDINKISEQNIKNLEADCYGCMTKLLDKIQENYIFSQPGIQKKVMALEEIVKRMDSRLDKHLKQNNIEYLQFAFRWMNNLLMRELPLKCIIRLWDTYHAEPFGFSDFHLYVCASFLLRFSQEILKQNDFQDLMLFLQNLPTKHWSSNDIIMLTAEAYKLQVIFASFSKNNSNNNKLLK